LAHCQGSAKESRPKNRQINPLPVLLERHRKR
jgi:hypothetical protein